MMFKLCHNTCKICAYISIDLKTTTNNINITYLPSILICLYSMRMCKRNATLRQSAKRRVVALSCCRLALSPRDNEPCDKTTTRQQAMRQDDNATTSHATTRGETNRQLTNPSIWAERQRDIATTRRTTTRCLACFASDRATRRQHDNAPNGALSSCR